MSDSSFQVGRYTVQMRMRFDNPHSPAYCIYRGEKFIGKQFSRPCESDCEWLERASHSEHPYTEAPSRRRTHSTGGCHTRNATRKPEPETA